MDFNQVMRDGLYQIIFMNVIVNAFFSSGFRERLTLTGTVSSCNFIIIGKRIYD